MTEAFNPYREWLGLDTDAPSLNHYQLLDLPEFEENTATIQAAAERAVVGVRSRRPGAQAAAWARLLDALAEAKACLTDPDQKSAYDASLRRGQRQWSDPTDSSRKRNSTSDSALIEDQEQPVLPEIALVNQIPDLFPPGMAPSQPSRPAQTKPASPPTPAPSPSDDAARSHRSQTHRAPQPGAAAVSAANRKSKRTPPPLPATTPSDASGLARQSDSVATSEPSKGDVAEPVPPAPMNAHVAPPRREPQSLLPIVVSIAAVLIVATLIVMLLALRGESSSSSALKPTPAQSSSPENSPRLSPARPQAPSANDWRPEQLAGKNAAGGLDPAEQVAAQKPPADIASHPPPTPDDPQLPDIAVQLPPAPTAAPSFPPLLTTNPHNPTSPPPSAPASPSLLPDQTELARLAQTLTSARQALAEHQFDNARKNLVEAELLATRPPHQAMVQRLRRLVECTAQFWQVVANVVDALGGTEELTIGSGDLIVIVVETGPRSITIRNQGRNQRYTFTNMPPGLALAIAKRQLDVDDPQHLVLLGACLATTAPRKPMYLDEARNYWTRAQMGGAEVDDLLLTLTDSYDLPL